MPIQQITLIIMMDITPSVLNSKFPSIVCKSYIFNNDFKDLQNPIVFIAAEIVLAKANKIPIEAPNSGPIDLEIIK